MNKKQIAIDMRVKDGKSYGEIMDELGVAKSTLSGWLQPYPLSTEDMKEKQRLNHSGGGVPKFRGEKSKYKILSEKFVNNLTAIQKGRVAEAATIFRLTTLGLSVYKSVFDCDCIDVLVESPKESRIIKMQIRWAKEMSRGLPLMNLYSSGKKKRYKAKEFDIFIGYDFYTDTAYVYSYEELVNNRGYVSIKEECAEAWEKLDCAGLSPAAPTSLGVV